MSVELLRKAAQDEISKCIAVLQAKLGKAVKVDCVEFSDRMSRTWGVASLKSKDGVRVYHIKLASKVFTEDSKAFRNTVAHEVAHLADFQIYNNWGHGQTWKYIMQVLGHMPTRCATKVEAKEIGYVAQHKKQSRYVYKCVVAGSI